MEKYYKLNVCYNHRFYIVGAHLILLQTVWWACVGVSVGANATPHVHVKHVHCSVGPCHQNYICIVLSGNSNRYYTATIRLSVISIQLL